MTTIDRLDNPASGQTAGDAQRPVPPTVRIVLVGTSHPGNVGATARAMQTMGIDALHLVAPECDPFAPEAQVRAAGAERVMTAMQVHADLDAAVGDCLLVYGCTARRRSVPLPELAPRVAAPRLVETAASGPVALLFGRERTGLENHELQRCHAAVHIPTDAAFGSLNLAAAVQVLAYEVRLAALAGPAVVDAGPTTLATTGVAEGDARAEPPATQAEMERFFEHLEVTLQDIDFHKGRHGLTVMRRLRRLFLRAALDAREVRMLRGIFSEAQRVARIAGTR